MSWLSRGPTGEDDDEQLAGVDTHRDDAEEQYWLSRPSRRSAGSANRGRPLVPYSGAQSADRGRQLVPLSGAQVERKRLVPSKTQPSWSDWATKLNEAKRVRKLERQLDVLQHQVDSHGPPEDDDCQDISDELFLQIAFPAGCPSVTNAAQRHKLSRRQIRRVHNTNAAILLQEQARAMTAAVDHARRVGLEYFVDCLRWDETLQMFSLDRDGMLRSQARKKWSVSR